MENGKESNTDKVLKYIPIINIVADLVKYWLDKRREKKQRELDILHGRDPAKKKSDLPMSKQSDT